jgi:membrane-bound lytic murein transglycosylase D
MRYSAFLPLLSLSLLAAQTSTVLPSRIAELDSLIRSYMAWEREGGLLAQDTAISIQDEEPEVYEERLAALKTTIPLELNAVTLNAIRRFLFQYPAWTARVLGLADYYLPHIEKILRSYGLPPELQYLPVIESALIPEALSPMAAAGIWQFIPSTARLYGLQVSRLIDERYNPIKSTHAAARYLQNAYKIFGDWLLVIAAYNCGEGRVLRAIKMAGGRTNYWEIAPFLPLETRGYVPAFVAACYIMNYATLHGIKPIYPDIPREIDTVFFPKSTRLSVIAKQAGVPLNWLKFYNAELRTDIVPAGYTLYVPAVATHEVAIFRDKLVSGEIRLTPVSARQNHPHSDYVWHTVRPGETLYLIARQYEVSPYQILRWNQLWGYSVYPGMKLRIKYPPDSDPENLENWFIYTPADASWKHFQYVGPIVYLMPRQVKSLPITLPLPENVPTAPELTLKSVSPAEKKALSRKRRRL